VCGDALAHGAGQGVGPWRQVRQEWNRGADGMIEVRSHRRDGQAGTAQGDAVGRVDVEERGGGAARAVAGQVEGMLARGTLDLPGVGRKTLIDIKKNLRKFGYKLPKAAEEISV